MLLNLDALNGRIVSYEVIQICMSINSGKYWTYYSPQRPWYISSLHLNLDVIFHLSIIDHHDTYQVCAVRGMSCWKMMGVDLIARKQWEWFPHRNLLGLGVLFWFLYNLPDARILPFPQYKWDLQVVWLTQKEDHRRVHNLRLNASGQKLEDLWKVLNENHIHDGDTSRGSVLIFGSPVPSTAFTRSTERVPRASSNAAEGLYSFVSAMWSRRLPW